MVRPFNLRPILGLLGLLVLAAPAAAQSVYDLRLDWSDVANPNGVWAYRQSTGLLSSGTWSSDFSAQPAWLGIFPTMWLRAQSTAGLDVQVGDIVTHTANGGNPISNVVWTSPSGGVIDIAGGVWMLRDIGRSDDWFIRHNGTLLSMGSLFSGDAFNRSNPFDLDSGTGARWAVSPSAPETRSSCHSCRPAPAALATTSARI
jgi:hypothetical protein